MKKDILTKAQAIVLRKARLSPIMKTPDGYSYSNGGHVNARVVNNLIERKILVPSADGLFAGFNQTYREV